MPEPREGAIPPELYSTVIIASGSIYQASRTLPGTIEAYFSIPPSQRNYTISVIVDPVSSIFRNRSIIDTQFKLKFGKRFFRATTDDGRAIVDISRPCQDERDFAYKIQALAGMIARVRKNVRTLIRDEETRRGVKGSIDILEAILNERFGSYNSGIISNLRKINRLRSTIYPTHTLEPEAIRIFEEMDLTYPPDDWNGVWRAVLDMCSQSFERLMDLLRRHQN